MKIKKPNYKSALDDEEIMQYFPAEIREDIVAFVRDQLKNHVQHNRYDYIEVLKLTLLFFGEDIEGYEIIQPGAVSRALDGQNHLLFKNLPVQTKFYSI